MIKYLSKVLYVLSAAKSQLILLIFIFVLTSVLEALGIGLIGPFIKLATNPESIYNSTFLTRLYQALNLASVNQFIPALGLFIAIVFCIKSGLYFAARVYIFHFSFTQKELLISKLLNAYLHVPYTFHLSHNTSTLIKNIVVETRTFTQACLLQVLTAISNLVIILALLLLLASTDLLLLTLILGAILPIFFAFNLFKGKFSQWGKIASQANQGMIQVINHGLGGIKETRVIGCEPYFERQMAEEGRKFARASTLFQSAQFLPRVLLETVLVIFVIAFVAISQLISPQNTEDLNAVLGVFAIAALRLIPSASLFIQAIGQIQNSTYTLDMLYLDLKELENQGMRLTDRQPVTPDLSGFNSANYPPLKFNRQIDLIDVAYTYPGTPEPALKHISLSLKKGQSIAFIGKSGAGKTTLVDVILGLLVPQQGDLKVDGISVYDNLRSWQNLIGYIPQSIFLTDDTIEHNIAFGVPDQLIDQRRLNQVIEMTQLTSLIDELPDGFKTQVGERGVRLSGGQRQRIGIARALYHEREILVLDEATAALDNETERLVSDAINALAATKTLIIIAHRLSTIEQCDWVYLMEKGQIVQSGSYQKVVAGK